MGELSTLQSLESILASEKDKRRSSRKKGVSALKIKKRGGEESSIDEIGELQISSPTLISRTTGWMSPSPNPSPVPQPSHLRFNDELHISRPVLISRTTSHVSTPIPSPNDKTLADYWKNKDDVDENYDSGELMMREEDGDDVDVVVRVGKLPTPIVFTHSGFRRNHTKKKIEQKLECSLEELCHGCVKKISIVRDATISSNGAILEEEDEEIVPIKVEAGWRKGTKIILERTDIEMVLVIDEKMHPIFERDGDDLELGVEVPLIEALTGCSICVPLLGGGEMDVSVEEEEIIYPGYEMIIHGEGMAKGGDEGGRGDLKLTFLVEFPQDLTSEQRSQIVQILEQHQSL